MAKQDHIASSNFTKRLATFVIETPIDAIPEEVIRRASAALIDTIGCALAGWTDETPQIALKLAEFSESAPRATIWGAGKRTSPSEAALVNGIAAHALDFDDSLPGLRGHPSAPIAAAAIAAGETFGVRGRELLAAYALALEVTGKIGKTMGHGHYFHGWHTTGTIGIFAATAAVSRLLGASVPELCTAWGLAASQMAGLRLNFGTMTKPFHVGHAARAGFECAWLAHNGFTANQSAFDGAAGVFAVYGGDDGIAPDAALDQLGNPWSFMDPGISVKRWPCCFGAHRPLGGIFRLIEENQIKAADVESVAIGFLPMSDKALTYTNPRTGLEGKFSIEYCAAAALLDGKVVLNSFTDEMVNRPESLALMAKVERRHIPGEGSFNAHYGYTDVEIVTRSGQHQIRVDKTPGSLAWPLSPMELKEKFVGCVQVVKDTSYAEALYQALQNLADSPDVGATLRPVLT